MIDQTCRTDLTRPLTERRWTFEAACSDGGSHTLASLALPPRCMKCGVEADEIGGAAPGEDE